MSGLSLAILRWLGHLREHVKTRFGEPRCFCDFISHRRSVKPQAFLAQAGETQDCIARQMK